ncbi:MAG TPA: sodium/glutamate symporter [Agitococcus sp.]|nr:sodium/glutamate symporter [Agitococcus sp.]
MMISLEGIATLAIASFILLIGHFLKHQIGFLHRYNLPSPVIGGFFAALTFLLCQQVGWQIKFDTTIKTPLMLAFFTSLGFAASLRLLKIGGKYVLIFLAISIFAAILQNAVGASAAWAMGLPPLLGVLCGSVTLTGGPATGLAFAPQFEAVGIVGAESIAVAAAMCGIIMGGVMGGPIGTLLIRRLQANHQPLTANSPATIFKLNINSSNNEQELLKSVALLILAMWLGGFISQFLTSLSITLPAYIGAMICAAILRNMNDSLQWFKIDHEQVEQLGSVALSYFLVLSLMGLDLSKLTGVAIPLIVLIALQVLLVAALSMTLIFKFMGKDYEAAVTATGFYGFMMGTTANAMANMDAFVKRYSPSPRAYLVVPIVGAFFIDFANTLLIQFCLNLFG